MICPEYEKLTPKERTEFIGKLVHAVQSDAALFGSGNEIIRLGERKGLFENVVINLENQSNETV